MVDDSIVVLENIKRHLGYGEEKRPRDPPASARWPARSPPRRSTTVAVFLPIALVGGMVGQLFSSFAITVTVALLASLFVALTVIPVLAYWFLQAAAARQRRARRSGAGPRRRSCAARCSAAYLPVIRFATRDAGTDG